MGPQWILRGIRMMTELQLCRSTLKVLVDWFWLLVPVALTFMALDAVRVNQPGRSIAAWW